MRSMCVVALAAGLLMPACARPNYVKADKVALGRVVVYRNGVAYYERRSRVEGDEFKVTVPKDRVDDFLKSLTVVDAETNQPLNVSFPRRSAARYGYIDIAIKLPPRPQPAAGKKLPKRVTDVVMTYVTEAPAWKPSYRVWVGKKGGVRLEGWAIVDNTSGEDWKSVRVGVGSSSAMSFRYDLWSVRDVLREKLSNEERFAMAPPNGMSPYHERRNGQQVVATLGDGEIPRSPGHPNYRGGVALGGESISTTSASKPDAMREPSADKSVVRSHHYRRARPAPRRSSGNIKSKRPRTESVYQKRLRYARRKVIRLARKLRSANRKIIIEGYARKGEYRGNQRALDRANVLRNRLIENGVSPGMVRVVNKGVVPGKKSGVRIVLDKNSAVAGKDNRAGGKSAKHKMPDRPVGESHFESKAPMTVARGTSAMVSIVRDDTAGRVVYLYDPESARGNRRYPFKAIRFKNPTNSTLETGPLTVFGDGTFIGEGLTQPVPPKSVAVVPFALDRQIVVEPLVNKRDHVAKLITLQRGILTAKVQHVRRTRFKLTSRRFKPATVYLRHTVRKGWKLTKSPSRPERVGGAHLFKITLKPRQTKIVDIEEATPIRKTIDLRTPAGMNMMKVYLTSSPDSGEFADQMHKLLRLQTKIADAQLDMDTIRQRMRDYRVRMDELHAQIVSLKAVKARGRLMRHLKQKLTEISSRVQKLTIELVNKRESHMKLRIRFQDGIAELTLDHPKKATGNKTAKK